MTRPELLTVLYSLKALLDKELYDDAKALIEKVIAEAESGKKKEK